MALRGLTRAMDELEIAVSGDGDISAALREAERLFGVLTYT